jgi:hypothetical protein
MFQSVLKLINGQYDLKGENICLYPRGCHDVHVYFISMRNTRLKCSKLAFKFIVKDTHQLVNEL